MKKLLLATALFLGSAATAQTTDFSSFPDFSLQEKYERSVIKGDADVQAYAKRLGATAFKVTNGKPSPKLYAVVTNNGCSFDVEVVYKAWPGVDGLVISKAICGAAR